MARSLDWSGAASRSRARRQGTEAAGGAAGRVNGAKAHREAADAAMITKILRCSCGHRGKVEIPAAMLVGRRFKCSACGRRI